MYYKHRSIELLFLCICYLASSFLQVNAVEHISLKEGKKEEKNAVNLILLIQKVEKGLTYLTL